MIVPDELNDDLAEILGRPNFACGQLAHLMVKVGDADIPRKAEAEQAAVIFKLLGFYAERGTEWRAAAGEWIDDMIKRREAQAA